MPGYLAYLPFEQNADDQNSLIVKRDASGSSSFNSSPNQDIQYVDGKDGKALDLDGNYYIQGNDVNLGDSYTIALWLRLSDTITYPAPLLSNDHGSWVINKVSDGSQQIAWQSNDTSKAPIVLATVNLPQDEWHHIALTVSTTQDEVYSFKKTPSGLTEGNGEISWELRETDVELSAVPAAQQKEYILTQYFNKESISTYHVQTYFDGGSKKICKIAEAITSKNYYVFTGNSYTTKVK